MAEPPDNKVIQLSTVKESGDSEDQMTNVLVIITQNGAAPLDLNSGEQQIVVVSQNEQTTPTKGRIVTLQTQSQEGSEVLIDGEDMPLYQDVSVQTNEIKRYTRMMNNKKYKCLICGKLLANSSILKRHIRIHTGVRPYQCSLCNKRFTQSNDLTAHMRSHTGSRPFKCEVCGKGFTQRQNVKKHMLTHTGEKNFACPTCGKKFSRKHHMEEHSRLHTHSEIRCQICQKGFTANGHLKRHLNKYHPEHFLDGDIQKIIQIEESGEQEIPVVNFMTGQENVETATVEIGSMEQNDQQISASQIIVGGLDNDKSLTENIPEALYRCDLCEKQFKDLSLLERHLRLHLEGKLFVCTVCQKVFNYKGLLKRHMVVHTKIKPYECGQCNKKFTQSNDLKIHLRLHTGVKPFKCDLCNLAFNQKQQLKNHRRKHTGERPFACQKCMKCFSRRDHLKAHIKTHDNDHLRCQICGFTSRNTDSLDRHMKKHDNIEHLFKPPSSLPTLSCRYCTKKYRDITRLHKHESSHESSKLYNCNICGLTYYQFETFEKHCKIHEKKDGVQPVMITDDIKYVKDEAKEKNEEYVGTMIKIEMQDDGESTEENEPEMEKKDKRNKEPVYPASVAMDDKAESMKNEIEDTEAEEENEGDPNGVEEVNEGQQTDTDPVGNQKNTLYCCSHCGKMLPWDADLVSHMETHLPDKPGERPKDVTQTGIVQTTKDGKYLCSICGRHFTNLIALQSHIKNIHAMDISDYELNYKESEGVMMTSEEIKMIEKQIQENLRFTGCYSVLKNSAKKHTRSPAILEKDKPIYQCEICAKVLKRKEVLDRHRKLHDIVHQCNICNKTFKQKNHLETHKLIKHDNTGGNPTSSSVYTCDEPGCGKYFNKKFNLQRHQTLHRKGTEGQGQNDDTMGEEGLMVFECRRCNEAFASFEALEEHCDLNHPEDVDKEESTEDVNDVHDSAMVDSEHENAQPGENQEENTATDKNFAGTGDSGTTLSAQDSGEILAIVKEDSQSVQGVIELTNENIPVTVNEGDNQIIIEIPPGIDSIGQNLFQIVSRADGTTEQVPIILSQNIMSSVATATSSTESTVAIETLTDNDNTAAIAMVALSGDNQYIEDEHAYVHSA